MLKELTASRAQARTERAEKRALMLANAEKYDREYQDAAQSLIDSKRQAKDAGNFFVEAEPRVAFLIRTRG